MSGYRVMAGVGRLTRVNDELKDMGAFPSTYKETKIYSGSGDMLHALTERVGAGVTLSISRSRNLQFNNEIGLREFGIATAGMYSVSWSMDGIFSPACCDWLNYVFMQGDDNSVTDFTITADNKLKAYDAGGNEVTNPVASTMYTVKIGMKEFGKKMLGKDIITYNSFATGTSQVRLYGYTRYQGPKYFDLGYQKINKHASGTNYDGKNEFGVLLGCVISSASLSYDSGSDAAIRFSISGLALSDFEQVTMDDGFDYSSILTELPTDVFVGGCLSVADNGEYNPVAQTDSASISISNNVSTLGNCNKLTYSSVALGGLSYDISTSTYSNDPEKYLKYLYGIESNDGDMWAVRRKPTFIENMKIHTDDTSATVTNKTMFLDINLERTYVGDLGYNYSVDSPIMDEPSLRAKSAYIAVGYKAPEQTQREMSPATGSDEASKDADSDNGAGENTDSDNGAKENTDLNNTDTTSEDEGITDTLSLPDV